MPRTSPIVLTILLLAFAFSVAGVGWMASAATAAPATNLPELTIPVEFPAGAPGEVTLPIHFQRHNRGVASMAFSVDIDTDCLRIDVDGGQSANDAVTFNLPPQFRGSASYDPDDADGELDIAIADYSPPLSTLPDRENLVEMTLAVLCEPGEGETIISPVRFSQQPPPSFSNTLGQGIPGEAHDGSVAIQRATPTAEPSDTPTPTPIPEPVNTAPIAEDDEVKTTEYHAITIDVLANDSDPDDDPLTVMEVSAAGFGQATVNPDGTITYAPDPGRSGEDFFSYIIGDGRGGLAEAFVTVTVTEVNIPPVAVNDQAKTVEETPVTIDALANDHDPDPPPNAGTQLTIAVLGRPGHGEASIQADGRVIYTPTLDFAGEDAFDYAVRDAEGATAVAQISVSVSPVNDPPRIDPMGPFYFDPEDDVALPVTASDPDTPLAALQFSATGLPDGLTCDPQGGFIHGTLEASVFGPHLVTVTVSDGEASASTEFWLTVATPAAIELVTFTATPQSTGALLTWRTLMETDTVGYYLHRTTVGDDGGQNWVCISPLIAAAGEAGGHYQFEDPSLLPGVRYQYLLIAHDNTGPSGEYLSQIVMLGAATTDTTHYLPLIWK